MKIPYQVSLFCFLFAFASNVFALQTKNGFDFYREGEYQKAIEVLQKAVETDKNDRKSWLYLGMSYARLKNGKQAGKAFEKADKIKIKELEKTVSENTTVLKITSKPRVAYTETARMNLVQGTVKIAVEFGADGEIKFILPFRTLPYGITEGCVEAVKKIKFEPATENGKSVSSISIISYSFTIY